MDAWILIGAMSNCEQILVSFETRCAALAEEEYEKSVEQLADAETALIHGRTLFKEHLARCHRLAGSDHVTARYSPSPHELVHGDSRSARPTEEELEQAAIDMAIVEFYRQMFGPDSRRDSSQRVCPDWQTAIVGSFKTKGSYLQAIGSITEAYKGLVSERSGLDSYLNMLLMAADAYERAAERMFNLGSIVGRYLISSELWEEQGGERKLQKGIELNSARALAGPGREAGFAYIDAAGDLAHSYHLASTIRNSGGETVASQAEDLSPVMLVPHTFAEHLPKPSVVAVIDFGRQQQYRLNILFQSKAG